MWKLRTKMSATMEIAVEPSGSLRPPSAKHRRIVVAMDGSGHSEKAFKYFADFIHIQNDYVIVVYVPEMKSLTHVPVMTADATMMTNLVLKEQQNIKLLLAKFAEMMRLSGIQGSVKQLHGEPGHAILDAAVKEGADFIVTGNRGLGTVRRTLMGSVSDYIVHHATIPVLVCRHD